MEGTGEDWGVDRPSERLGRTPTSESFTEALILEVEELRELAEAHFGVLDPTALSWSPGTGRWGVGACIDHLVRTNALYHPLLRAGVERLEEKGPSPNVRVRGGAFGRWFATMSGPQPRIRLKAPASFRPAADSPPSGDSLQVFMEQQDRLIDLLGRARGLPLDRFRLRSPVSPLIRFRLTDAFRLTVGHEWRHLRQARNVMHHPGFPR